MTLESINNYITDKSPETCELEFGDMKIEVRTRLTVSEQMGIVKACADALPITSDAPSPILMNALLDINFVRSVAPSLPLPVDEGGNIDIDEACRVIDGLDFIHRYQKGIDGSLYRTLENALQEHIKFDNEKRIAWQGASTASEEAIESVAELANQAKMAAFNLNGVLGELRGLIGEAKPKLIKFITKKNVDRMMVWFENLVSGFAGRSNVVHEDDGDNIIDIADVVKN